MNANYVYSSETPHKGDLCLFIWKCDEVLLGNEYYNNDHLPILVPVQIIDISEDDIVELRPRILVDGKWMIFSLGTDKETGETITTLPCQPGDGVFERLIHYDWYTKSGGEWTNQLYKTEKSLQEEVDEARESDVK